MKRFFLIIFCLIGIGCSKDDVKNNPENPDPLPSIKIDGEDKIYISDLEQSYSISFNSSVTWSISVTNPANPTWISLGSGNGSAGKSTVTINVLANTEYSDREAKITIQAGTVSQAITITQKRKGALFLASDIKEISCEETTLEIELKTNLDYEVVIPPYCQDWIIPKTTRALETYHLSFEIKQNELFENRQGEIVINDKESALSDTVRINQSANKALLLSEKEFILPSVGGTIDITAISNLELDIIVPEDQWIHRIDSRSLDSQTVSFTIDPNENDESRKSIIVFKDKNSPLSDTVNVIQEARLIDERDALIAFYQATGGDRWHNKTNWCSDKPLNEWHGIEMENGSVAAINFYNNNLTGRLPEALLELKHLRLLNLYANQVSGEIPEWVGELTELTSLTLSHNQFTGKIPASIGNLNKLTGLELTGNQLSGPIPESLGNLPRINHMFLDQNNLTGTIPASFSNLFSVVYSSNNLNLRWNRLSGEIPSEIINHSKWREFSANILQQQEGYGFTLDTYESTDYSQDGKIVKIQEATKGNGIDIVVMGDGFTDKEIADGTYETVMKKAMENFFSIEPTQSFREYFNFYYITTVSKHHFFGEGFETALGVYFGGGAFIGGDDKKCFKYASKIKNYDPAQSVIIVVANTPQGGGTAFWYDKGEAVVYFPMTFGLHHQFFASVLHHEAIGHGFAKLADEYFTEGPRESYTFPKDQIAEYKSRFHNRGWHTNVDFTSDPDKVLWSRFLKDSRYQNEGLGIFEGGATWPYGVYRSSENSTMNDTYYGAFNAPSREAIYKRIMELAYGDGWVYDYEEFVAYDAINRNRSRATTGIAPVSSQERLPHHPPVFKGKRE